MTSIRHDIKKLQDEYKDISGNIETCKLLMDTLDKDTNPKFKNLLNNVNQELNNYKVKVRNDQYKERQKIYDEIIKKIYDDKEYKEYNKNEYYKNDANNNTNNNICKVPYFVEKKELKYNPKLPEPYDKPYEIIYEESVISFAGNKEEIDDLSKNALNIKNKFDNFKNGKLEVVNKSEVEVDIKDIKDIYINNTIEKMLIDKKSGITHANQFNNRIGEGINKTGSILYNARGNTVSFVKNVPDKIRKLVNKVRSNNNNVNTPATPANPDIINNNTITGGGIYSINESCNNKLVSVLTVKDPRLDLINLKMEIINYIEYIKDIRIQFNKKYRELVQEEKENLKKRKFLIKQLKKFSKGGYLKTKKSKTKKSKTKKTKKFRSKKNKKTKKIN